MQGEGHSSQAGTAGVSEVVGQEQQQQQENTGNSLYVGNLDPRVSNELLYEVFSLVAPVQKCKVVGKQQFGFVDFEDHQTAQFVMEMFQGRRMYEREMRVDWAHFGAQGIAGQDEDAYKNPTLFVKNVDFDASQQDLEAWVTATTGVSPLETRYTPRSGHALVAFREKSEAELALGALNGKSMKEGKPPIKAAWARPRGYRNPAAMQMQMQMQMVGMPMDGNGVDHGYGAVPGDGSMPPPMYGENGDGGVGQERKGYARQGGGYTRGGGRGVTQGPNPRSFYTSGFQAATGGTRGGQGSGAGHVNGGPSSNLTQRTLDDILQSTSPINSNVYIAGLSNSVTDAELRDAFSMFGDVVDIRIPENSRAQGPDRAFAFVRLATHEQAANAIFHFQSNPCLGKTVTCNWGKDTRQGNYGPRMFGGHPGQHPGHGMVHGPPHGGHPQHGVPHPSMQGHPQGQGGPPFGGPGGVVPGYPGGAGPYIYAPGMMPYPGTEPYFDYSGMSAPYVPFGYQQQGGYPVNPVAMNPPAPTATPANPAAFPAASSTPPPAGAKTSR